MFGKGDGSGELGEGVAPRGAELQLALSGQSGFQVELVQPLADHAGQAFQQADDVGVEEICIGGGDAEHRPALLVAADDDGGDGADAERLCAFPVAGEARIGGVVAGDEVFSRVPGEQSERRVGLARLIDGGGVAEAGGVAAIGAAMVAPDFVPVHAADGGGDEQPAIDQKLAELRGQPGFLAGSQQQAGAFEQGFV